MTETTTGSQRISPPRDADVIVVGAGIAGLTAADELASQGVDVVVLEASERVGGRMLAEPTRLGSAVDLGGQWIGAGHHRFAALAARFGTTTYPMQSPNRVQIADATGTVSPYALSSLLAGVALLGIDLASRVPGSLGSGERTVADLIARLPVERARRLLEVTLQVTCCADSSEMSAVALLGLIRHQRGLAGMMKTTGGAQDSLVVEGAGTLARRLADGLAARVYLNCPVTRIDHDDIGVTVRAATSTIRAGAVIVTAPPPQTRQITFDPALPQERIRLQHNTYMGAVYKAIAVYSEPFWRADRDAEMIMLDEPGGAVFDSSPPGGPGHLTLLIGGNDARRFGEIEPEARRLTLLDRLAAHLGERARRAADWHDKVWHHDPFVGGGYACLPRLGSDEGRFPIDHTPTGSIHWAGTETADEHAGYIEGAIASAHRVVTEITRRRKPVTRPT